MSDEKKIVALGMLTSSDLQRLGSSFTRAFAIDGLPYFAGLLSAIDDADQAYPSEREKMSTAPEI